MRLLSITLTFVSIYSFVPLLAQQKIIQPAKKIYTTAAITNYLIPEVDGKLDEAVWYQDENSTWATDFIQRMPNENTTPSEQTSFKIVYDSKYLYIGIRCYDATPDQINSRMSRRDGFNGDWVEVVFDSYHDLRSAFSFTVSAAGVKSDKSISLNGAKEDLAWNPIWYTKSDVNQHGWTTEMKIPLSQLRFGDSPQQVWGLQVQRRLLRKEELSTWQRVPLNAPGWVSEFGELHGLINLKPQQQLEIQPFAVGSVQTFEKEPLNPYRNENITSMNFGLDGKVGVTNDLTLDFTVNPDFGQVEADPAAIALDGFQLFFEEQRPFFVENKNIFDYRFSAPIIGGIYSSDNLFYSRRIGRSPQAHVSPLPGEYVSANQQTTILGAVKFSGKTNKGLSVGVLESVTAPEYAEISGDEGVRRQLIEPTTNYFVGRVQQDFNHRNTFIGGIFTAVNRDNNEYTNFLHESAYTGGVDIMHQWKDRTWYLSANLVMSHVKGSRKAILRTQTSIPHLFQREDASYATLDSTRTSLTGTGGDIKFGKAGNGHVQFESGLTWRSPGLELNDIGFMREAGVIQHYFGITYSSINSFGAFRNASVGYKHWINGDFDGNLNYIDWDIELNATFKNNWSATFGVFSQPHNYSNSLLQGGPRIQLAKQYGTWWGVTSDTRKKLFASYSGWTKMGGSGSYYLLENSIGLTYQPVDRLSVSLRPKYTTINHRLQYNETQQYQGEPRYITSMLDQRTFSLPLRFNLVINANLAIQYYSEPFITTGKYRNFSYVAYTLSSIENDQLHFFTADQLSKDAISGDIEVDENRDGASDYHVSNPDFSFAQFRSNLVLRYEYRPGSEIFLVWSQGVSDRGMPRNNLTEGLKEQVFRKTLDNTFLIKMTYRFHK
ncbi:MAG: DUF5916 domain-containing protein [Bacteroidota bacterium]